MNKIAEDQLWKKIQFEIYSELIDLPVAEDEVELLHADVINKRADIAISNIQNVIKKAGYKFVKIDE